MAGALFVITIAIGSAALFLVIAGMAQQPPHKGVLRVAAMLGLAALVAFSAYLAVDWRNIRWR